jgi:hypothetical protein
MAVNTLVTGLIVGKIWVQSRQLNILRDGGEKNEDQPFNRVITLMIESGLMNFVIQLLYLVLYSLENPAFSLVETCTVHFYVCCPLSGKFVSSSFTLRTTGYHSNPSRDSCYHWEVH